MIVASDGSVLFGVGYHGWIIATRDEQILPSGGGPDDGPAYLMSSYRLDLGGIVAGLAAFGTLFRSGRINIRSVHFLCYNESTVLSKKDPSRTVYSSTRREIGASSQCYMTCWKTCAVTLTLNSTGPKEIPIF
jgi:hypothetical protein